MGIYSILALLLTAVGIAILVASLTPVSTIITSLPRGRVRNQWYVLFGMIILFIAGFLVYGFIPSHQERQVTDLFVHAIFIAGALFVWMTVNLALQTTRDVRRVSLLEKENITDALTGAYNRRFLDHRLEAEFDRAWSSNLPLSILMVDIDRLKDVNNTHGHPVGDLVLAYLAHLMQGFIRTSDILARYGGEEFVIISLNTPPYSAGLFAERLLRFVESHELVVKNQENGPLNLNITVSIGVAGLDSDVIDVQTMYRNAEDALYRAKQEGRNRVASHNTPCPIGDSVRQPA